LDIRRTPKPLNKSYPRGSQAIDYISKVNPFSPIL